MPWEAETLEMKRKEFVKRVLSKEASKSALCREYNISRPTGDKWIRRYQAGESLTDLDKAPHTVANRTDADMEQTIVHYRLKYPAIGAVKLRKMLENEGFTNLPSVRTFNAIFHRNHLITPEASAAAKPYQRFEKAQPNEMWQADFKGHFEMKDHVRCHPLNIIDDCSRFNLCCDPLPGESFADIQPSMIRIFQEYGLPQTFLCDNGNPWGTAQSTGFTRFEVWLMDLGILTIHGRIRHPQTQGKEERFNQSMTRELLKQTEFLNMEDAWQKCQEYRDFYNQKRPHMALNLDTPASRYQPSPRRFPSSIPSWDYPDEYKLHKVKSSGYLTVLGQGYFLSEAFGDRTVALKPSIQPAQFDICYCQFILGRLDVEKRVFVFKKAYLLENDPRKIEVKGDPSLAIV